ncbi:aromatase/cyclase [Streptomyces sp. HD]|nr:aromatase/cyclase [Streptomyces sp. HD]MDC0772616.1 aromatase/cyclase [Streptomyces sp. HD]
MGGRQVEHEITLAASADEVYRMIAEVENWPRIFPPTIHVEHVERGEREERIRIWATANGEAKSWTSLRVLEPERRRIAFRQEIPAPPVAAMGGAWVIEELPGHTARVRLLHDYRALDDDPEGLAWIDEAVDRNSRTELAALKKNIERARTGSDLTLSFEDTVRVDGQVADVYAFINEAHRWPDRLPHVARTSLTEDTAGLQTLDMDTRAKDGSTHTTKSYRVTFPHRAIAYKQVTLPALMTLHTGLWTFDEQADGAVAATSQHTVVLNPATIEGVLGPDATVDDARRYVRDALGANSRATLGHAKAYAEQIAKALEGSAGAGSPGAQ